MKSYYFWLISGTLTKVPPKFHLVQKIIKVPWLKKKFETYYSLIF